MAILLKMMRTGYAHGYCGSILAFVLALARPCQPEDDLAHRLALLERQVHKGREHLVLLVVDPLIPAPVFFQDRADGTRVATQPLGFDLEPVGDALQLFLRRHRLATKPATYRPDGDWPPPWNRSRLTWAG
jgi:hypothetical protein